MDFDSLDENERNLIGICYFLLCDLKETEEQDDEYLLVVDHMIMGLSKEEAARFGKIWNKRINSILQKNESNRAIIRLFG